MSIVRWRIRSSPSARHGPSSAPPISPRSLSVGARQTSSRGPRSGAPPSRSSRPVRGSNSARIDRPARRASPSGRLSRREPARCPQADYVPGRRPRRVIGQHGAHGQPALAARASRRQRRAARPTLSRRPRSADIEGTRLRVERHRRSRAPSSNRRSAVSAKSRRLRTVIRPSAMAMSTGSMTLANSISPGDGVRSGNTKPSVTKLPSCSSSPKSPP